MTWLDDRHLLGYVDGYGYYCGDDRKVMMREKRGAWDKPVYSASPDLEQRIAELEDVLQELMIIVDGLVEDGLGGNQIDSFTTQPARLLLKKRSGEGE